MCYCRRWGWGWGWTSVVPSLGPRVVLLLHSPLLEPGPPALLFPTRSISTAFVGSNAGGVGEGQSGGWGVQAGAQGAGHSGAGLWAPRLPDEGALPGSTTPPPHPGSQAVCRPRLCPFFHTGCSEHLCCRLHPELRDSSCPPGKMDTQQGRGGHGSWRVCVCVHACVHVGGGAEVRSAGKGVGLAGFSVSSPT